MTFLEITQRVYQDCGYAAVPATDVITRVKAWINDGHRRLLRDPAMTDLRQGTLCFSSIASVPIYGAPQVFERIDVIVQPDNNRRLRMMTRDLYRALDPGETASGLPSHWVPEGLWPVLRQPNETGLYLVSTSASDTAVVVNLQGATGTASAAGLGHAPVQTTLTGTTRVQVGTDVTYRLVESWNLASVAVGSVQLWDAAIGGNLLANIPVGFRSVQYDAIRLWPTPASAWTFNVDGQYAIPALVQDTDIPMLPPSYHELLADYGRMKEYERTQDGRYGMAASQWADGSTKLKTFVQFPSDYRPVAGQPSSRFGFTNLPDGWYPADRSWP